MADPSDPAFIVNVFGGVAGIGALIISLVNKLGGRVVDNEDKANTKRDERLSALEGTVSAITERQSRFDERHNNLSRELGRAESENARLAGKVDGLQSDWRARFEKLQDELRLRDERLMERIIEAKAENSKGLSELRETFESYRITMHERFNELTRLFVEQQREILDAEERERRHHTEKKG